MRSAPWGGFNNRAALNQSFPHWNFFPSYLPTIPTPSTVRSQSDRHKPRSCTRSASQPCRKTARCRKSRFWAARLRGDVVRVSLAFFSSGLDWLVSFCHVQFSTLGVQLSCKKYEIEFCFLFSFAFRDSRVLERGRFTYFPDFHSLPALSSRSFL